MSRYSMQVMGEALKKRLRQQHFESPVVEAVLNLMVAADHVRSRVDRICEEHGITNGQYNVLRILRGSGKVGRSRCEIAERLIERAPDVTRLVDRLETQGFVERDRSEDDRRLSIARITKSGLRLLDDLAPRLDALDAWFAERVSRKDCRELSRICEGIYGEEV